MGICENVCVFFLPYKKKRTNSSFAIVIAKSISLIKKIMPSLTFVYYKVRNDIKFSLAPHKQAFIFAK